MKTAFWLLAVLGVGLGTLSLVPEARAHCYGSFYYRSYNYSYSPPVKIQKEYVKEYIPVAAYLPVAYVQTAQLGYGTVVPATAIAVPPPVVAPAAPARPAIAPDGIQLLMTEIRGIGKRLDAVEKRIGTTMPPGPGGNPPPPPGPRDDRVDPFGQRGAASPQPAGDRVLAVYAAKCAACHGATTAMADGGGLVLLDNKGQRAPLDPKSLQKFSRHMVRDTMPPKNNKYRIPPLTDEERTDLLDDLPNFPQKKEEDAPTSDTRLIHRTVIRANRDYLTLPRR